MYGIAARSFAVPSRAVLFSNRRGGACSSRMYIISAQDPSTMLGMTKGGDATISPQDPSTDARDDKRGRSRTRRITTESPQHPHEIQTLSRLPYGFRLRPAAVILSGAARRSRTFEAQPQKREAESRRDFAQDDTVGMLRSRIRRG